MNGLRSDFERVIKTEQNDEIKFNLCGNISKKCAGKSNVSACFITHDKKEFILGKYIFFPITFLKKIYYFFFLSQEIQTL